MISLYAVGIVVVDQIHVRIDRTDIFPSLQIYCKHFVYDASFDNLHSHVFVSGMPYVEGN